MDDKILWDIIDGLRDELNNDVVKDLQAESIEQIKDNKWLNAELNKEKEFALEMSIKNDELKAELMESRKKCRMMVNKADELQAENDELKHELKHKAIKIHQDKIPMEYKAEASEYFDHNPKSKGVRFHMIDFDEYTYDNNDGLNGLSGTYGGELYAEDCIIEIDNL